jgi:cytochrome c2
MEAGEAKAGEKLFKKCKACHQVGTGAKNRTGPILTGIVGSPIGAREGYKYSKTFKAMAAEGKIWTLENLAAFLTKPKAFAPKTKMSFSGFKKEADRNNIIAYLASVTAE